MNPERTVFMPTHDYHLLNNSLVVATLLFTLGAVGFLSRRNLVVVMLSSFIMLQGVAMAVAGFGSFYQDRAGEIAGLFAVGLAVLQAVLFSAFAILLVRREGSLDVSIWSRLRTDDVEAGDAFDQLDSGPGLRASDESRGPASLTSDFLHSTSSATGAKALAGSNGSSESADA
jgi:NADH-quinone oxidoreductase subunit K